MFTFTNTKKAVNVIIDNNDLVFKKADAQLKDNINSAQFNQENKPSLLSSIIQTTPNWDKNMFGEINTINNDNLLPQKSSVKTKTDKKTWLKWIKSFFIGDEKSGETNIIVRRDRGFNENYDKNCVNNINKNNDAKNSDTTNSFDNDDDVIGDTTNSSFDNPHFVANINNKLKTTTNKPFLNHNKNDHNLSVSLNY